MMERERSRLSTSIDDAVAHDDIQVAVDRAVYLTVWMASSRAVYLTLSFATSGDPEHFALGDFLREASAG